MGFPCEFIEFGKVCRKEGPAEKTRLTITFRDDGQGQKNAIWLWMNDAYSSYDKKDSIELNVAPITASEGDYFSKIALALQSPDTAPDIVTEDTFQLNAEASAGYLLAIDDYLKDYPDWQDGKYIESLKKGVTASDGKLYGLPYNTDTRGLWYNNFPQNICPRVSACRELRKADTYRSQYGGRHFISPANPAFSRSSRLE